METTTLNQREDARRGGRPATHSYAGRLLTAELVPSTCWYSNVRSEVPPDEWDAIRRAVYRRAGHRCEVCGGRGPKWPVECHEVWDYDDRTRVQRLVRMIALCPPCHEVKHFGLATVKGREVEAWKHLVAVNDWTKEQAVQHTVGAMETWERRSEHEWALDISIIQGERYQRWLQQQRRQPA